MIGNIDIEVYTLESFGKEEYKQLFKEAFEGQYDEMQIPSLIFVGTIGGKRIGFASGYVHNKNTFYLQYVAILPKWWLGGHSSKQFKWFEVWVISLYKSGFRYILTYIESKKNPALMMALENGWEIMGLRVDTLGRKFVELIYTIGGKKNNG